MAVNRVDSLMNWRRASREGPISVGVFMESGVQVIGGGSGTTRIAQRLHDLQPYAGQFGYDFVARMGQVDMPLAYEPSGVHAQKRSEEHTSAIQSLMRSSYAVFCLKQPRSIQETYTHIKSDNLRTPH